jgi:amino acid transporter
MRILVQFVAQAVGVVILRRREGVSKLPFKMWLYPLPVILSIGIWLFVWVMTGKLALYGLALASAGVVIYFLTRGKWGKRTIAS